MNKLHNYLRQSSKSAIQQTGTNTNAGLKARNYLFFALVMSLFTNGYGQNEPLINLTPNGVLDNVFDQQGTKYNLADIMVSDQNAPLTNRSILISCSATSRFDLYFEPGCGMETVADPIQNAINAQRRAVVCQVFQDISNFINIPFVSTKKVKIWVRNINTVVNAPTGVLGVASAYYNLPTITTGGITDNEIWKTIHANVDSYTNLTPPLTSNGVNTGFYHGYVAFNFNPINTTVTASVTNPINWQTNLQSTTIPANYYDLYSTVLREVTHALGFTSLIDANGNSKMGTNFKYYNRYDKFLKNNGNSKALLTTSSACSSGMYNYGFNTANFSIDVLHPNPLSNPCIVGTTCANALRFVGTSNVPVYTPICFSNSSLSHFEDALFPTCATPLGDDGYFVMCNGNNPGIIRRYLKPEERNTLCDLGYSVKTTYGTATTYQGVSPANYYGTVVCTGITVAGTNDGLNAGVYTFKGNVNSNIIISGATILGNDKNANSVAASNFTCLEDITAASNLSITTGTKTASITFSSAVAGVHLLRYVPVSGTIKGNVTYIYVKVQAIALPCTATTNSCNLVSNGDFEQNIELPDHDNQLERACGWYSIYTSPDYFYSNPDPCPIYVGVPINFRGNQTDSYPNAPGDGYGGQLVRRFPNNPTLSSCEIMGTTLSGVLLPNTNYQLKLDISLGDLLSKISIKYQAFISSTPPANLSGFFIPMDLPVGQLTPITYVTTGSNQGILCTNATFSNNTNGWDTLTFNFTTGANTTGMQYLYLGGLANVEFQNEVLVPYLPSCFSPYSLVDTYLYYYIDNVKLFPTNGTNPTFPAIPIICQNGTVPALPLSSTNIPPITGTWNFPTISNTASGNYTFTPTAGQCANPVSVGVQVLSSTAFVANDDTFNIVYPVVSTSTPSVLYNDTYNGGPIGASLPVGNTIVLDGSLPAGIILNYTTGVCTVQANTPAGTYTFQYHLHNNCNFDTPVKTVKIIISNIQSPPKLNFSFCYSTNGANSTSSTVSLTLYDGVTIAGVPANASNATIVPVTAIPAEVVLNANGTFNILPGTLPGFFTFYYKVCSGATNCSDEIFCEIAIHYTLRAYNDLITAATNGAIIYNVLSNDQYYGDCSSTGVVPAVAGGNVTVTEITSPLNNYYSISNSGLISQNQFNPPTGTYILTYQICDVTYPLICQTADVWITVPNTNKLSSLNSVNEEFDIEKTIISPNLNEGIFSVYFNTPVEQANIEVYNLLGQKVYTENVINSTELEVTINELASGTYIVKISSKDKVVCKRIVIK